MEYYNLNGISRKVSSLAVTKRKVEVFTQIDLVRGLTEFPIGFELFRQSFAKGEIIESSDFSDVKYIWEDFLSNQFAWPMMSERMAEVVRVNLTGNEGIDWVTVSISGPGEERKYYVPRFSILHDVLDNSLTTYSSRLDFVVQPWVNRENANGLAMFTFPHASWEITPCIIINEPMMKALKKAKLSGVAFSPARSS